MPQPGEAPQPQPSAEDSFLDLLVETTQSLDEPVRAAFLRQFFRTLAQVDIPETQTNEYWEQILQRRRDLTEALQKKVSLKTAIVDVLGATSFLRVPILIEYEEFKKLQINAATDALTGLYNRRLFDESCEKEMNRAKRYGQHLGIVLLDLHKLKEVNDREGHLQGDRVLQLVATTLRKALRASDMAFRIGGDEFALLLPQTDPEQAVTLCRRVRARYEAEISAMKIAIGVTLDFGVAVHPEDGDHKETLIGLADKRLYDLKHSGRSNARTVPGETRVPAQPPPVAAETPQAPQEPTAPRGIATAPPAEAAPAPTQRDAAREQRKWERVSLSGTKAYAVLSENGKATAKVMDLSYGGVALQMEDASNLPAQFNAILHVPILPPVRVILRKAYVQPLDSGRVRVGCAFVS